jgi:hypothetical protein
MLIKARQKIVKNAYTDAVVPQRKDTQQIMEK